MNKYRFHIPGLLHLPVSPRYTSCAYTQKIIKLSKMLMSLGHEVYIYGAEGSDVECTEFIQTHTLEEMREHIGDGTDNELGYDWYRKASIDELEIARRAAKYLNGEVIIRTANEIAKRKKPDDFLLLPVAMRALAEIVGLPLTVESGIGYPHSFARFRVFESSSIMHLTYGGEFKGSMIRPNKYDRVIPNYFDPCDFEYKEEKQGFILYIGRVIYAKGITIAVKVADALNKRLIIAGQGANWDPETGRLWGKELDVTSKNIEYVGFADKEFRKKLLSDAEMVLVPSLYAEPFGGTNVEAQLSGTPVLTTAFGAFPETVRHGETGFICHTNEEFIKNAQRVGELDKKAIRRHAERYLMDNVKHEYQDYFDMIYKSLFS